MLDGIKRAPDGMRADVYGNLWISANAPSAAPSAIARSVAASQSPCVIQTITQGAAPG